MTSEHYRNVLNKEFKSKEMNEKDFDNTLMHFAMFYHKEQSKTYFAGKALQGLLSNPKYFSCDKKMIKESLISQRAFSLADDMIKLLK